MILFEKKKAKSPDLGDPFLLWQGAKSNIELAAFLKNGRDKEARGASGDIAELRTVTILPKMQARSFVLRFLLLCQPPNIT
jgi:hypothetical protein